MPRVCPVCLKLSEDDVARCECGYSFDAGEELVGSRTVEVVRQATTEDQYEKFYAARLEQAQNEVKSLIARYGTSGWTPAQRAEIEQAIKQVEKAKADLNDQRQRTGDAQKHLEQAKTRVQLRHLDSLTKKKI
ncbi:MAG: hypothetical protein EPN55_07745 [Gammaproteobacteria bacterium]|nr:MAG: hypothetical protein EPN55_07745 [Gammaproteobacteria bacterium]